MKNKILFLYSSICLAGITVAHAQSTSVPDTLLIGNWKGNSICQVKNSPCHDEIAVYHITRGNTATAFNIQMNKIVNGVEEDMGILPCLFDQKKGQLTSDPFKGIWTFTVKDQQLDGTLFYGGGIYRKIKATKQH